MLRHSHSMMNHQDKNSQIFIKNDAFSNQGSVLACFWFFFRCKYWRTLPAPFYRRGIKCCSTSNTWTTEQGWHVNIEWVLLHHFSHPMLIFGTIHQHLFPPECSSPVPCDMQPTKNVDTWTIVNIGKFQLFLWPSLANRLSPQTFCARKAAATDRRTRFWPLTHTEIFSPWFRSNFGLGFLFWRQKCLLLLPSIVRREQFSVLRSRESRDCLFWPGVRFLPV